MKSAEDKDEGQCCSNSVWTWCFCAYHKPDSLDHQVVWRVLHGTCSSDMFSSVWSQQKLCAGVRHRPHESHRQRTYSYERLGQSLQGTMIQQTNVRWRDGGDTGETLCACWTLPSLLLPLAHTRTHRDTHAHTHTHTYTSPSSPLPRTHTPRLPTHTHPPPPPRFTPPTTPTPTHTRSHTQRPAVSVRPWYPPPTAVQRNLGQQVEHVVSRLTALPVCAADGFGFPDFSLATFSVVDEKGNSVSLGRVVIGTEVRFLQTFGQLRLFFFFRTVVHAGCHGTGLLVA